LDDVPPHQEHAIRRGRSEASAAIWQWQCAPQEAPRSRTARLVSALKGLVPGALKRALDALVALVTRLVTWVVLRSVFYGVFVPLGWLLRTSHRDPLQRSFEATRASYWSERGDGQKTRGEHLASAKRARQY